jgi:hypothetical protein
MALDKILKNDLYKKLIASGIEPEECDLEELAELTLLTHRSTGAIFRIESYHSSLFKVRLQVERPWAVQSEQFSGNNTDGPAWPRVLDLIEKWAHDVIAWHAKVLEKGEQERQYQAIPDLWALRGTIPPADIPDPADNASFTPSEREEIAARLDAIKRYAKEAYPELSSQQFADIERGIDELKEATERVGHKDWRIMLYGTALNMIVTDLVPPHIVQSIFTMAIHSLAYILGGGGPPPSIAP